MDIAIFGLGYVGMTAVGCLAKQGHKVVGVDPNETKVTLVNSGHSPIVEPGLDELVAKGVSDQLVSAYTTVTSQVASCEIAIVCVGTPSSVDGSHNMSYIVEATRQIAEMLRGNPATHITVVYRSTMRPGSVEEIILPIFSDILGDDSHRAEVVYNPEFLRESSAIADYFEPPKIVIGTRTGDPSRAMTRMYEGINAPVFHTGYRESEITKFVDNSFHALKTAFANELGRVCSNGGIDVAKVHEIFISDTKLNISANYLRPGGAFGGSCLPKDVRALQHLSRVSDSRTSLIDALIESNEAHKDFIFGYTTRGLKPGSRVLLIGIAFKNNSDDLRESPNIDLARELLAAGHQLSIYDPNVSPAKLMGQNLGAASNSPFIRQAMIDQATAESSHWDRVVSSWGANHGLDLLSDDFVDIGKLS